MNKYQVALVGAAAALALGTSANAVTYLTAGQTSAPSNLVGHDQHTVFYVQTPAAAGDVTTVSFTSAPVAVSVAAIEAGSPATYFSGNTALGPFQIILNDAATVEDYTLTIENLSTTAVTFTAAVSAAQAPPSGGSPTPEPASWALMIVGLGGVGFAMRRHAKMALAA